MEVFRGFEGIESHFKRPVITLGNFDGVHLGHREIFSRVTSHASSLGVKSAVLTFEPHPVKVLRPEASPKLINSLSEKLHLIKSCGIDATILADFTRQFAEQHPSSFVKDILVAGLGVQRVIVGHDFTFGKGKEGTIAFLEEQGLIYDFAVEVVDAMSYKGEIVSSTRIRTLIASGNVGLASELLARPHSVTGRVIEGHKRGKPMGFPTANIHPEGELYPGNGVYAVQVEIDGCRHGGVANVGIKPTFGDGEKNVEVHIFDFEESIYGKAITVLFCERIREERRFSSTSALVEQIRADAERAREIIKGSLIED